ncbi:helix-turn-helix domain-containing protein [Pantoea sp. BAV 3049]|uniref:helix-turn-helix domain-containing protein n=1 Tax=Pantoea sp. BAV 3049 TaxID=2654188 RepID=UPI00131D2A3A|nr:helix-turn-helix transcriptional regulator [Pantoea sp. BAV 3049]
MKDIADRIRELRELLDISRKEVEIRSGGLIKATSLSSFENAQSQISISYLRQLVEFYKGEGIETSFDWLIAGNGPGPSDSVTLESNLSALKEVSFFKKNNYKSLIYTVTKSMTSLNIAQGDIIGGVYSKNNPTHSKFRLFKLNNGETCLYLSRVDGKKVVIFDQDQQKISYLPLETVQEIYDVVWIRKFI